jgi:hypothetical protein
MNTYKYKVIKDIALAVYAEHGMETDFDVEKFNGVLVVEAPDEETSEKIRSTFTDIRMWERIEE